jgi:triosephosphate isomerase (TIM)
MKPIIIANWKMNLNSHASLDLAKEYDELIPDSESIKKDIVICPSTSCFLTVAEIFNKNPISLGVQDIFWESKGAFTGCESPKFIYEEGCRYVIIGHSERRSFLKETDEMIHKKIKEALDWGITPILCVGETYEERASGMADNVIMSQVIRGLSGIDLTTNEHLIIAYEPVWVIGSGRPIEPEEAEQAFRVINQAVIDLWPLTIASNNIRIIYGGSVDGSNASEFVNLEHFKGFLVGGASLRTDEFLSIIKQTK